MGDRHVGARSAFYDELLIDGESARGRVRPAHAAALCTGHFPGDPFVPGAYLAGIMADLAERLMRNGRASARLQRVARCWFRARVKPDAEIVVLARRAPRRRVEAEVRAEGVCAARATLVFGPSP